MFRIQSWWNIWVFFLHKLITIRKADLSPFKRKSRIESAATCLPANINRMSGNTNRPKVCVLTYKQSGLDQSNKRSIASIMVALSDFYLVYIKQIYFHISIYIYIFILFIQWQIRFLPKNQSVDWYHWFIVHSEWHHTAPSLFEIHRFQKSEKDWW